jgi:hypothetical protein
MSNPSQSPQHPIKDRDWWREHALDLIFFNSEIMPFAWDEKFHDFGKIHAMMCKHLDPYHQKSTQIYLSAHRGSGKTTQLLGYACWWLIWSIVKRTTDSMIYNTATKENCWNMQSDVKHSLLQNDFLHWVFPEMPRKENEWDDITKNRIKCRQVKLDFASLETTLVSRHYPKWINDDLENDQNSKSDYSRSELIRTWKYQKAILTKIRKRNIGREMEVGTPYHVNGLTWKIRNMNRYSVMEIPCYKNRDKNQGVWYDELYDVGDFEEKRDQMGASIFSAQYLLQPLSEEDALCPEAWLKHWDALPDLRWRTMVVDPGGAEPGKSDATGITICDTDENGNIYVVYAEEHFLTPMKFCDLVVKLKEAYDVDDCRVEKEKYSITVADLFRHRYPLFNISFVEHKGRSKGDNTSRINTRIWRLKQWFESKRIFVGKNQKTFIDQLLTFPQTSTGRDDIMDSLAYHLDIRRIPKRQSKMVLPSGRVWEPSVEEKFDAEYDAFIGNRKMVKGVDSNDASW